MTCLQGAIREILEQHRFADPIGTEQDDVCALGDEAQRQELLDEQAIELLRPGPIEITEGLKRAEPCDACAIFETSPRALVGLDRDEPLKPVLAFDFVKSCKSVFHRP